MERALCKLRTPPDVIASGLLPHRLPAAGAQREWFDKHLVLANQHPVDQRGVVEEKRAFGAEPEWHRVTVRLSAVSQEARRIGQESRRISSDERAPRSRRT